jgi:streptogramin lyase
MFDGMTGAGWTAFGSQGYGVGQFYDPLGIFLDSAMRIYITDGVGRIIRVDDMTGKNWTQFGTFGSGTNQFRNPSGIFVDGSGKIYVADGVNNRIVRINDMSGAGWTSFGSEGAGINQFNVPNMLFVDPSGRIYITDSNNCRVVRIDDMSGAGWTSVGTCGSGTLQFNGQAAFVGGVFVDTAGRIYVADAGNSRLVRMNDMSGNGWVTLGTFGSGTGQFAYLNNVFVKPPAEIIVGRKK